jgi:hypothetical protein
VAIRTKKENKKESNLNLNPLELGSTVGNTIEITVELL